MSIAKESPSRRSNLANERVRSYSSDVVQRKELRFGEWSSLSTILYVVPLHQLLIGGASDYVSPRQR